MSLYGLLAAAQHGQVFANLGRRFGVAEETVANVAWYALPILMDGLERRTSDLSSILDLLRELGKPGIDRLYQDAGALNDLALRSHGVRLAIGLLDGEEALNGHAGTIARKCRTDPVIVARMMPHLCLMALAAIRRKCDRPFRTLLVRLNPDDPAAAYVEQPFAPLARLLEQRAGQGDRTAGAGIFSGLFMRFDRQAQSREAAE